MNNYYDVQESGKRLRDLRMKEGMTQDELSEKLGITKNAYQKIERGANGAKIDTLIELAEIFKVSLDYIVCGKQPQMVESMISVLNESQQAFILATVSSMIKNFELMKDKEHNSL